MLEIINADLTRPDHANALLMLLNDYALDLMGGGEALPDFVKTNLVAELKRRTSAHVVLGFVDGSPAGLMIGFEGFSTFACKPLINIHDVVVAGKYRGQGIARKMLSHLEKKRAGAWMLQADIGSFGRQYRRAILVPVMRIRRLCARPGYGPSAVLAKETVTC